MYKLHPKLSKEDQWQKQLLEHIKRLPVELQETIWKYKHQNNMARVFKYIDMKQYLDIPDDEKGEDKICYSKNKCIFHLIWLYIFKDEKQRGIHGHPYSYQYAYSKFGSSEKGPSIDELSPNVAYIFTEIMIHTYIDNILMYGVQFCEPYTKYYKCTHMNKYYSNKIGEMWRNYLYRQP